MNRQATTEFIPRGSRTEPRQRFAHFAWGLLGYTLLVILFGAVVRITGSGAGCGQHWPSCNGALLQMPQTLKTAIEYAHRATSGLSVFAIVALLVAAFRVFPRGHATRAAACMALAMILVEALIGALLVKLRLVENDASLARIVVLPLHLISTALLTGALTWCAWFATRDVAPPTLRSVPRAAWALLSLAGIGILLVSATGAVTALGDTVYPMQHPGLAARLQADQGENASLLQNLRDFHPFLAVAVAAFTTYAAMLMPGYQKGATVRRASQCLAGAVCLQVMAGVVNIWLSAPGAMQVVHLLFANLAWIAVIVLAAALLSAPEPSAVR
ncbi:MAG: COX15/CtaA family protein [Polyangiaceae bacterium]